MRKTILVVGGAGYIGAQCCKLLSEQNYRVVVLDNLCLGHLEFIKWGKFYLGDLGDKDLLAKIFTDEKIDAVMHFAAFASVAESVREPQKYYQNNVIKTISLLDEMIKHNIKHFIFSSTCATFGNPLSDFIDEMHTQKPINPYGYTKLVIENVLKDYDIAYGLKSIVFRYFNAAGADESAEIGEKHFPETHLIPLVLDVAIGKSKAIKIFGTDYNTPDGTCIRDYIHVYDLSQAHILGLKYLFYEEQSNHFNLGNGLGFSVKEIIDHCEKVTGIKIKKEYSDRRAGDPSRLVGSSEKAIELLNWQPKYFDIEKIIQTAWVWHKKLNKIDEIK
jgi:UDP-glucose 4-epimerase